MINNELDFLEKCFLNGCFKIIGTLISISTVQQYLNENLINLINYYAVYKDSQILSNLQMVKTYLNNSNNYGFVSDIIFHYNQYKTGIIYNKSCIDHIKLPDSFYNHINKRKEIYENSDRVNLLIDQNEGIFYTKKFTKNDNFIVLETQRESTLSDILRCHNINYIMKIKQLCSEMKYNDKNKLIDEDTLINYKTYETLFKSTGVVLDAVDLVVSERLKNAFAILRPPGHHAGYFGAVSNEPYSSSNGFCFVNNVCIGAAYCKYRYKQLIKKIAIFDFDVHHGNGSEEIIKMLKEKQFTDKSTTQTYTEISITKRIKNIWCDLDDDSNVLFISVHHFDENNPKAFYPYSGSKSENTLESDEIYPGGILNIPLKAQDKFDYTYKNIIRTKIIPRLNEFKPDIIFISAGFDGHENEVINKGYMLLQEYDFGFITEEIQRVANKFCNGRVVSVLEGGYNVRTGIVSSFVQSAMIHALALNCQANKENLGDIVLTQEKRQLEYNNDYCNFKKIPRFDIKPRRSERISKLEEDKIMHELQKFSDYKKDNNISDHIAETKNADNTNINNNNK